MKSPAASGRGRVVTYIIAAMKSFLYAWEIKVAFYSWVGTFLFGAILMIRWQASGMIALSIHRSKKQPKKYWREKYVYYIFYLIWIVIRTLDLGYE
jgi:hypothetical protein